MGAAGRQGEIAVRIVSIVGARPEFIQAQPVIAALRNRHDEILVHTGQHYDYLMSQAFFDELGIPSPDYNLGVGSGTRNQQLAAMITRLESVFLKEKPDLVIVRGDTNSTAAGALAAAKMQIAIAHVEAGERSYDRRMPEEVNRVLTDAVADLHFCVSRAAVDHLAEEGVHDSVYWVGDVMLDALQSFQGLARSQGHFLEPLDLQPHQYALVTIHRAANTDDPARLASIVEILNRIEEPVVFPIHPRTRLALSRLGARLGKHIQPIEPVPYLKMLTLEENARLIATDSGGVQREAYYLGVPCLTLRDETEWTATVSTGWNKLVGIDPEVVLPAWRAFSPPAWRPPIYGDGTAASRIAQVLDRAPSSLGAHRNRSEQAYVARQLSEEVG